MQRGQLAAEPLGSDPVRTGLRKPDQRQQCFLAENNLGYGYGTGLAEPAQSGGFGGQASARLAGWCRGDGLDEEVAAVGEASPGSGERRGRRRSGGTARTATPRVAERPVAGGSGGSAPRAGDCQSLAVLASSSASPLDQPADRRIDQVIRLAERGRPAAVRVGHLRAIWRRRVERPEQPDPPGQIRRPCAIRSRLRRLDWSMASSRSNSVQPVGADLPGPVRRPVEAVPGQLRPRPAIHLLAQVPVAGARALHPDPLGQAGAGQFGPEQGFCHRGTADVAQAYHANLVYLESNSWEPVAAAERDGQRA